MSPKRGGREKQRQGREDGAGCQATVPPHHPDAHRRTNARVGSGRPAAQLSVSAEGDQSKLLAGRKAAALTRRMPLNKQPKAAQRTRREEAWCTPRTNQLQGHRGALRGRTPCALHNSVENNVRKENGYLCTQNEPQVPQDNDLSKASGQGQGQLGGGAGEEADFSFTVSLTAGRWNIRQPPKSFQETN